MTTKPRITGPHFRFAELDSVRALAALWVFAYHVWQFAGSPKLSVSCAGQPIDLFAILRHGPAGVDMFMVLSGFCLFWPLTNQKIPFDWRSYATKRARRILPAYYSAIAYAMLLPVLLVFAVRLAGWQANFQPVPSLRQVVFHLLFIHTLFADTWSGITGAFWSMGLEAQFYAVFPFLAFGWKRLGVRVIVYAALASIVFRIMVGLLLPNPASIESFLLSITFLGRWMQFAAGMAAALWVRHRMDHQKRPLPLWQSCNLLLASGALELAGLLAPSVFKEGPVPLRDLLLATGSAGLLAGLCSAPPKVKALFLRGPLPQFGRISYSFFLIHQPTAWYVMEFFRKKLGFSREIQALMGLTAGFLICTACTLIFYLLFEKPFLNTSPAPKERTTVATPQTESIA